MISKIVLIAVYVSPGWQKLREGPKVILRFVIIYAFFGRLWAKKMFFWAKNNAFGQELHYCMVYIAYCSELNLQVLDDFDDFPNNLNTIFKMIGKLIHVHI